MSEAERYRRTLGVASADVDGDVVLVSPSDRRCFSLNRTAIAVWTTLPPADGVGMTVAEVAEQLTHQFDVDRARCATETTQLLASMAAAGVVTVTRSSVVE